MRHFWVFKILVFVFLIYAPSAFADDVYVRKALAASLQCLEYDAPLSENLKTCAFAAASLCETEFDVTGAHECEGILSNAWKQLLQQNADVTAKTPEEQKEFMERADKFISQKCFIHFYAGGIAACNVEEYASLAILAKHRVDAEKTKMKNIGR